MGVLFGTSPFLYVFYILCILRCSNVSTSDLVTVYVTLIRPLLEYGCIVWHFSLPLCLSDRLESIQKRALRIILPHHFYAAALEALNLPSLLLRRECLCSKSFSKLTSLANPRFIPLLPPRRRDANDSAISLRNSSNFTLPAECVLSVSNVALSHPCFLANK